MVQVTSLAPHRLNRALRPSWFFDRPAYGGIINDIGVHSIDQFLAFADAEEAEIVIRHASAHSAPSRKASRILPSSCWHAIGARLLSGWTGSRPTDFPPGATAGCFVVGTEGTLELRKNLDIKGRAGTDHLFVANRTATRYVDCSRLPVTYYRDFLTDIANRTETVMQQRLVFTVCRLALQAQAQAVRYMARRP